ncbi:hypothetical protein MSAN_01702200 [Mycena sanguinolenta]|uniref:Uncharacterized protein n=1 Tax=Mycena sanguinolenta TaxID=230812 RepID=A0A8H7CVI6_9AGAR|nr:hypothetical protein MSAN_01702200 [Mycena sanguinolenta]
MLMPLQRSGARFRARPRCTTIATQHATSGAPVSFCADGHIHGSPWDTLRTYYVVPVLALASSRSARRGVPASRFVLSSASCFDLVQSTDFVRPPLPTYPLWPSTAVSCLHLLVGHIMHAWPVGSALFTHAQVHPDNNNNKPFSCEHSFICLIDARALMPTHYRASFHADLHALLFGGGARWTLFACVFVPLSPRFSAQYQSMRAQKVAHHDRSVKLLDSSFIDHSNNTNSSHYIAASLQAVTVFLFCETTNVASSSVNVGIGYGSCSVITDLVQQISLGILYRALLDPFSKARV